MQETSLTIVLALAAMQGCSTPASTGNGSGGQLGAGAAFVDKIWSAQIPTGTYRYYDGTLYMLGLLHVSGTFKLWF